MPAKQAATARSDPDHTPVAPLEPRGLEHPRAQLSAQRACQMKSALAPIEARLRKAAPSGSGAHDVDADCGQRSLALFTQQKMTVVAREPSALGACVGQPHAKSAGEMIVTGARTADRKSVV